ncbi:MAG TPA: porin [Tepidisphaeraceae bacterium]|jgi:outer membrane murein-binding lipoprotein Lpp|nr:porin [Tepidisphaeraceae bacterium]
MGRKTIIVISAAAMAAWVAGVPAWAEGPATQPTNAELQQQNQELLQRLDSLEQRVDQLAATTQAARAEDVGPTNQAITNDIALHSPGQPLADVTGSYAPSVGFVLSSADGAFTLHPGFVADFRYLGSYRQDIAPKGGGETDKVGYDTEAGFTLARMRFTVDGTFRQNIGYFIQIQNDQGAGFGLLDAYATYHFADTPFTVKAGQFKDPLWHERNISEARLLTVDRTETESLLGGGQTARVQGAALIYDQDRIRAQAVFHDGFNSLNTKFYNAGGLGAGVGGGAGVIPTDFGVSGRAEYLVLGQRSKDLHPFQEYDQFTSLGAQQDILIVGAGFDWSQARGNDVLFHTVDAQYNSPSGLGIYAAYLGSYRDLTENQGVKPGNYYDPGIVLQASYLVTSRIEPFARFDYTYLAAGSTTGLSNNSVQEYTLGVNYYLYGQNVKFTLDGVYLPDGAPADNDAAGILKDSGHNEFVLRAQFQLAL